MLPALAAAAVVSVSTASPVSFRDGSATMVPPDGYAVSTGAPAEDEALRFTNAAGDAIVVRDPGAAGGLDLEAAAYDELKALEARLAAPGRPCVSTEVRDLELAPGRRSRGASGLCGAGPAARAYGVLISTAGGRPLIASAVGRLEDAAALLASVRAPGLPASFPVPARRPLPELAPLPPRAHRGRFLALWAALFVSLPCAAFIVRAAPILKARLTPKAPPPPSRESPYPIKIERVYGKLPLTFYVLDNRGGECSAVSDRKPSLLLFWGAALLALAALQRWCRASPLLVAETGGGGAAVAAAGFLIQLLSPREVSLVDRDGRAALAVRERRYSPLDPAADVRAPGEEPSYSLRRGASPRAWELVDERLESRGRVVLELSEASPLRSAARRAFGHLWGLLRPERVLRRDGRVVGRLARGRSFGNDIVVEAEPGLGLDPRLVAAVVLYLERVEPARWHPWPV